MRYSAVILAIAGIAAAQSVTSAATAATSTSGCGTGVDAIIKNCLGTENLQLSNCDSNDWDCLCEQSGNVNTCYNNCPSDPNAFGSKQQEIAYCNAAKAYGTKTSATPSMTPTATMASSSGASTTTSGADASKTSGSSLNPNNGANGVAPGAGIGLVAALFGAAALF